MLEELFGDAVVVADSRDTTSLFGARYSAAAADSEVKSLFTDGSEYLLGVHLARLQRRDELAKHVATYVASCVNTMSSVTELLNCWYFRYLASSHGSKDTLSDALHLWYDGRDDSFASKKHGDVAVQILSQRGSSLQSPLAEIYEARALFAKPSKWIFGGSSWATDIGYGFFVCIKVCCTLIGFW